jgi:GH24 family phage-related lysozyme (muramidase)
MGNALDLQFRKGDATTRCSGSDVDHLRAEIFVKRLGAQLSWPDDNKLSLETAAQGATSWVHMDVREYEAQYKDSRYYAINQAGVDGDSLAEMARREGRLSLLVCGGVASPSQPVPQIPSDSAQRIPVANLTVSAKGLDFVKAWETCKLEPYDDSEGFCTIGWGHLIDRKSCSDLKGSAALNTFRNGVTQGAADDLFAADVRKFEDIIKERIQVPLFQHEYDALTSLIFNLGGFRKCPKLLSKLNTGTTQGAAMNSPT